MRLHFSNAWLRRMIARDPDNAEVEAGPSNPSRLPRFFIDHDVIHDRVTGKHVRTCDCLGPFDDGIAEACQLLNDLAA